MQAFVHGYGCRMTATPFSMAAGAGGLQGRYPGHGAGVAHRAGFPPWLFGYCLLAPMLSRMSMGILQTIVYAGS